MKVRIPNSGGPGNMNQMIKQAQKMQRQMESAQEELEEMSVTATAGGGVVEVTVSGKTFKVEPGLAYRVVLK